MKRLCIVGLVVLTQLTSYAQAVIINEMSQGSASGKEWVELLVVEAGADLRGWELGDNDDGSWHTLLEFTSHPEWQNVPAGTLIVLFNAGDVDGLIGGTDSSFSDKVVLIGSDETDFVMDTGLWGSTSGAFANSDADDCAAIRDAGDTMVHDLAGSHPTATIPAPGSGQVVYYTSNSISGLVNSANWTEAASSEGTPGQGNGGENSLWIDSSLPVELVSWNAYYEHGRVVLRWSTAAEIENQGFILKRGVDVNSLEEIASFRTDRELQGKGSTNFAHLYAFDDTTFLSAGTYFYQLLDVDYRNRVTEHEIIPVRIPERRSSDEGSVLIRSVYPNPFNPSIRFDFQVQDVPIHLQVSITDLRGRVLRQLVTQEYTPGDYALEWDGYDGQGRVAPAGVYYLNIRSAAQVSTRQITLAR